MGFKSRTKTFTYKFADGQSQWVFRGEKLDDDEDTIQNLTTETISKQIKPKELRRAKREHRLEELVMQHITHETRMSTKRATLLHMSVSWDGPEFVVPDAYETEEGVIHPLAGQKAPLTAEWVGARDPNELDEILELLEDVWAGRSEEEEATFSGSGERVDLDGSGKRPPKK